jgi:hypothetical protein
MALSWSISDSDRLIALRTKGVVTLADLEGFLPDVRAKSATSYRMILDAREGQSAISRTEQAIYQQTMTECAVYFRFGPCAIVADERACQANGSLITLMLSSSRRRSGLFTNSQDAQEWLRTQATPLDL